MARPCRRPADRVRIATGSNKRNYWCWEIRDRLSDARHKLCIAAFRRLGKYMPDLRLDPLSGGECARRCRSLCIAWLRREGRARSVSPKALDLLFRLRPGRETLNNTPDTLDTRDFRSLTIPPLPLYALFAF